MWMALRKLSVPEETVNLVTFFQEDMKARIHLDGILLDEICMEDGLRQGCSLARMPFNFHM